MSEAIAELMSLSIEPAIPTLAAATILYRHTVNGPQIFLVKRDKNLSFAGGFFAFPGGKVDFGETVFQCAARELFEETGMLMANGKQVPTQVELDAARTQLLDKKQSFESILKQFEVTISQSDFVPVGQWITPAYLPVRFDAQFYLVEAKEHQLATVWPGELSFGDWVSPSVALEQWETGTWLFHPPNLHALKSFHTLRKRTEAASEALANLIGYPAFVEAGVCEKIEFQKGIHTYPLKTLTLPPATHTNCYILGNRDVYLVDVGTDDELELMRLQKFLAKAKLKPRGVILTHHHGDHMAGASILRARLGVPLMATERTKDKLKLESIEVLTEGQELKCGDMTWTVHLTPGHASGHLILVDTKSKAAIVGDMVAGIGTIVIETPDGNMGEYLRQLGRMKLMGLTTLYPAHGVAIPDGVGKIDEYLQHRAWRETKVLNAVFTLKHGTLEDIVPVAYDDVASFVWPLAERNTQAILEKLAEENRVQLIDNRYQVSP
jgi:endoribonuclease LACTB2